MTSRPSRIPEAADLRPYQRRIFWGLRDKARDGERDLGLSAPVGSGKTTVCKALACDLLLETEHPAQFRGVIFLAPLESIVEAWQEPARIREAPFAFGDPDHPAWEFRGAGSAREWLAAPRASVADLSDPAWWQTARGLWAATRQSGGRQVVISALRESRPSLAGWLVVVDEAHGAGSETLAGELCAVVRELGGATLLVSATPWRGDGESVFGATTAVEGISSAAYSRETDERGRAYCPRQWEVRRTRVRGVIARTVADVVDDGGSADRRDEDPAKVATAYARTMVARWVEDGRPKTVMNVPRVSWVRRADGRPGPLLAELLRAGVPRDRVLDLVGKLAPAAAREAAERLKSERGVRRFEDSAIDVVLSCVRFDEGSDWPLCSHVYNAKIPRSSRLIIQRWGRASRPKGRIAGYPEQWRDAQVLRFFVASLPGEVSDAAWAEHRDMSLMLACYLEDFAVARRFASAAAGVFRAVERRTRGVGHRGRLGDRGESGAQRAASREIEQVSGDSELERSALRREIMRATRAGARRPEDVLAHLERRLPGSTPQQRQAGLLAFAYGDQRGSRDERLQRAVDAAVRKVAEQAARAPKPQGWVKAELREVLAAVAEDFANVMISLRSDLIEQAARFTGHQAGEFAERLRGEGGYAAAARADAAELINLAPATALARALAFRHPSLRPDQLSEIAAAAIRPAPAAAAAADGPRLPALDTDRLFERCPVVARRVADVSATLGVQRSAPTMCALFLASTAAADRLRLKVPQLGEPWIMPLHLFGLVALAGGNKSATQKAMGLGAGGVDLLAELERWAADQVADDAAADRFARHMAQQRATKAKDAAEAVAADKVLRRPPIHVPRVRLDDVTPESFVRRAQESGYVAMHCDEMKDALDTFLGRKAGEDRLDVVLKAFSGVKHTRARVGEDREGRAVRFEELHASVLWWSQPAVVSGQVPENRDRLAAAADRGLFPRFLVAMPERQPDPQPVGDDAAATREAYLEHMRRLLLVGAGGDHPLAPRVGGETFHGYTAVVDEDAAARVLAYQARCRRDGQEGGRWHESRYLRAAAPRLGELAARLAGLLALLRVGELRHDIAVDLDDVERAIEALEGYFIPHLEALVEAAESSPVEVLARKVYGILEAKGPMTETDLLRGPLARAREFEVLSHAERRTPLLAALEWLQRRGLVVGEKAKPSAKALTWHPQIRHPFGAGRVAGQEVR